MKNDTADDHQSPPAAGRFGADGEQRRSAQGPVPDVQSFEERFVASESAAKDSRKGADGGDLVG